MWIHIYIHINVYIHIYIYIYIHIYIIHAILFHFDNFGVFSVSGFGVHLVHTQIISENFTLFLIS